VPEAAATEKAGGAIILIAEDNEDDALFLRWAFTNAGLGKSVVFVRDGEEAVKYLSGQPPFDDPVLCPRPGLLLLDGRMPKMDGLEVLVWLRQHPEVGPLNVLMCTSALTPGQRVQAVELGAKACVDKPVLAKGWNDLVEQARMLCVGPAP
jgi:CheY-like chemotaxis protein